MPSVPMTVEQYIAYARDTHFLVLWGGGRLQPFRLMESRYRWTLFPIQLEPGYYRIVLSQTFEPHKKSIIAYAIAFQPGKHDIEKYPLSPIGFGFHMTPAIASSNCFETHRNVTNFETPQSGVHTLAVTTRDWSADVEQATFEVALLKNKIKYLYK